MDKSDMDKALIQYREATDDWGLHWRYCSSCTVDHQCDTGRALRNAKLEAWNRYNAARGGAPGPMAPPVVKGSQVG